MPAHPPLLADEKLGPTLTIGEVLVEIMALETGRGFLEPTTLIGPYPSGAPAIFIDQVAKLGGAAGIIAGVGQDDFGRVNIDRLRRDGVDVSAIAVSERLPTGSAFVRYRPDGERDFIFNIASSAAGDLALSEAAQVLIQRSGHLHVMGSALTIPAAWPIIEAALHAIKGRNGSVSFDPNLRKELMVDADISTRFQHVLDATDLFLPSEDELGLAAPGLADDAAIRALLKRGIGEIVLKQGKRGATRHTLHTTQTVPGFTVGEVDPTGAGDCFGAAYVTALRLGYAPLAALRLANAAGALNVTRRGPMEGTSTLAELDAFLAISKESAAC